MNSELLAKLVDPSLPDEWYVTDGFTSVGPVNLTLLARGIEAGKVPKDAFVRHASWTGWRGLADLEEHAPSFDPRRTIRILPAQKEKAAAVAANAAAKPPPPAPTSREAIESIDIEPDAEDPLEGARAQVADAFATAGDLPEALLLLLATAVERAQAEAALVHRTRENGAVVVCSHGARMFELLGDKLVAADPVLFAAKQGLTMFSEPVAGAGGRVIKARLSRLGSPVESAFMVPLRVGEKLVAVIEVGRSKKPFRAVDVAVVELLVDALVATVESRKWSTEWQSTPMSSREQ